MRPCGRGRLHRLRWPQNDRWGFEDMTGQTEDLERKRFPWAQSGFDMEGVVGAVAAWLVGILLGLIWDPLFWIGAAAAVLVLLATRRANRSVPGGGDTVVSPVDGVLVSVEEATPPSELRLPGAEFNRLRISSSPASPNGLYAPLAGEVETLIREAGEPSVVMAMTPETHGLAAAYVTFASGEERIGLRIASGGLGPRLDVDAEAGDPVRMGRRFGRRRLGGWCDVYIPADRPLAVWPGMTLVGAETCLVSTARDDETTTATPPRTAETVDWPATGPASEVTAPPAGTPDDATGTRTGDDKDDAAEMFARLRSKVEEASKRDSDN